jgi:hypothetical protein
MSLEFVKMDTEIVPNMTGFLDGILERADDVLSRGELAVFVDPPFEVFSESQSGHCHDITVDEFVLEQIVQHD